MGGDHNVREREQPGCGRMLQDLIWAVFKDIFGFFLIYIQPNTGKLMHTNAFDQIIRFDKGTSWGVDKDHTIHHFFDRFNIDKMIGVIRQRAVKGDQIAPWEHLIQWNICYKIL